MNRKEKNDATRKEAARFLHDMRDTVQDFPAQHSRFNVRYTITELTLENHLDLVNYVIRVVAYPGELRMFNTLGHSDPIITAKIDSRDEMSAFWERLGEEAYKLNAFTEQPK